jgi:septal ring factor EnvC (AmiA/AmiB activator)
MTQPATPDAQGKGPVLSPDSATSLVPLLLFATSITSTLKARAAPLLPHVREYAQTYVHEHIKTLELQLLPGQQRQQDRVEDELKEIRQHIVTTTQELRQYYQTVSSALRKTIEESRKELSDALYRLSQDVDRARSQSEVQNRQTVEHLINEVLQPFPAHDLLTIHCQLSDTLRPSQSKPFPATAQDDNV